MSNFLSTSSRSLLSFISCKVYRYFTEMLHFSTSFSINRLVQVESQVSFEKFSFFIKVESFKSVKHKKIKRKIL